MWDDVRKLKLFFPNAIEWLYVVSMTCLFLKAFYFKFFFSLPDSFFLIISIALWLVYSTTSRMLLQKEELIKFALLAFVIFFQVFSNKGDGFIGQMFVLLTMGCLLATSAELKKKLLKTIIYTYGVICLISLIGWISVCIFQVHLPYSIISFHNYRFYDYGIFNIRVEGVDFSRYLGMFIEPGYTGVMCVLLLMANGFNFNKKINIVILGSALATLSLAAYLLLFTYLLLKMCEKGSIKKIIVGLVFVGSFFWIIHTFLYDLSWLLDYFFKTRLEGMINGNITGNRFSANFEDFFSNSILNNPFNLLLGIGSVNYLEITDLLHLKSAGYKVYIAQFGIINTGLILYLYFKCICQQITYSHISIYIIWLLSFVDIAYPTWACFLIYIFCFDSYMNNCKNEELRAYA